MANTLITKNRALFSLIIFIVLYRLGLDFVYINYLSTTFGYMGFGYDFSMTSVIISWLLLVPLFPVVKKLTYKQCFSSVILLFLIHLSYIPFTAMVAFSGSFSSAYIFANTIYWFCLLISMWLLPDFKLKNLKNSHFNEVLLLGIAGFFALVVLYVSVRYTGLRFTLDLSMVYDMRKEVREFGMPTLLKYLFAASKVVNPVLLAYFLTKKRWGWGGFMVFIQFLSFSVNGSKTVFFSTILTVLVFYFYKPEYLSKLSGLFIGIMFITIVEKALFDGIFTLSYIVRRVLFLPNQLGYYYFDYFTLHTPDYFRQGFLRLFGFRSPYMDIDHLIGLAYYGRSDMGANNGLISDAVTNLGGWGIVVMPLLLTLVLKLLDACSKDIDTRIYMVSSITIAFILIGSFLNTALVTHGILAVCFVLYLLPRNQQTGVYK